MYSTVILYQRKEGAHAASGVSLHVPHQQAPARGTYSSDSS